MNPADLADVNRIADEVWGTEFYEAPEVFADKLAFYPEGCYVYIQANQVVGYAFTHPAKLYNPPKLNSTLEVVNADVYHIHDIAILPQARGYQAVKQLMVRLKLNNPYHSMSLIAVNNSEKFWTELGFHTAEYDASQYSPDAVYMINT